MTGRGRSWIFPDSAQLAVSASRAKVKEWLRDCRNHFFAMEMESGSTVSRFWLGLMSGMFSTASVTMISLKKSMIIITSVNRLISTALNFSLKNNLRIKPQQYDCFRCLSFEPYDPSGFARTTRSVHEPFRTIYVYHKRVRILEFRYSKRQGRWKGQ